MTPKIFILSAVTIRRPGLGVELKKTKKEIYGFVLTKD